MYGSKRDVLGFGISRGGNQPSDMTGGLPLAPNFAGADRIKMDPQDKQLLSEQRTVPLKSVSKVQADINGIDPTRNIFLTGGLAAIPKAGLWRDMKFKQ